MGELKLKLASLKLKSRSYFYRILGLRLLAVLRGKSEKSRGERWGWRWAPRCWWAPPRVTSARDARRRRPADSAEERERSGGADAGGSIREEAQSLGANSPRRTARGSGGWPPSGLRISRPAPSRLVSSAPARGGTRGKPCTVRTTLAHAEEPGGGGAGRGAHRSFPRRRPAACTPSRPR